MNYELTNLPEQSEQVHPLEQLEDGILREVIGTREVTSEAQEQTEVLIGDLEDLENWHMQAEKLSCTVSMQELVGEQLLGRDLPEQEMIDYARKRGWYDPAEGVSERDATRVLEEMGFEVNRERDMTLQDLLDALAEGEKVICGINTMAMENRELADLPGIKANHVVQLVAVDFSNPEKPQAIVNDMALANGKGVRYDLDVFLDAWKAGRNFAVTVGKGAAE